MNGADIAWMIVATGLVLLMTPALAFFYGGLVRSKNALNTMMMSFASLGVVGVLWALAGYSLAFAPGTPSVGGLDYFFLRGVGLEPRKGGRSRTPLHAFRGRSPSSRRPWSRAPSSSGCAFPPISSSSRSGASSSTRRWRTGCGAGDGCDDGRPRFRRRDRRPHQRRRRGARRRAGARARARTHGARRSSRTTSRSCCSATGLLWFGWLGFNGGSALAANSVAALASVNTMLAPMATALVWMLLDLKRAGSTAVGAATGIVVGLVAITPAAGFYRPASRARPRGARGVPELLRDHLRARTRLDDSLDVIPAHGLGGIVGALLTGVFAGGLAAGPTASSRRAPPARVRLRGCSRRSSTAASVRSSC